MQTDISKATLPVKRLRRPGDGPPGPKGLPIVGHLFALRRDVLQYFTDCSREYGDVVALRFAGWPTLLLSSPEHIEQVLVRTQVRQEQLLLAARHRDLRRRLADKRRRLLDAAAPPRS